MALSPTGSFSPRRGCENPRPSKFPNLFDLDLREPGARSFLSSDCNNLRGVISKLGVHVGVLTRQQINFSVLTFYPNRQPASDAVPRARSVFRTTRVVGDVTGLSLLQASVFASSPGGIESADSA